MHLFRKKSVLVEREKRVKRELADLQRDIRDIEKGIRNPRLLRKSENSRHIKDNDKVDEMKADIRRDAPDLSGRKTATATPRGAGAGHPVRRERLVRPDKGTSDQVPAYLASAIHANRPLRYEREKQRNKAILMLVIVALFALWFLFRLLLA